MGLYLAVGNRKSQGDRPKGSKRGEEESLKSERSTKDGCDQGNSKKAPRGLSTDANWAVARSVQQQQLVGDSKTLTLCYRESATLGVGTRSLPQTPQSSPGVPWGLRSTLLEPPWLASDGYWVHTCWGAGPLKPTGQFRQGERCCDPRAGSHSWIWDRRETDGEEIGKEA